MTAHRMTAHRRDRRRRDAIGAAMVELPFTFVAISVLVLCITALGQVMLDYHHVSGAARAGARYATKSDYDPTRVPASSSRRPTDAEVVAFTTQAAEPLPPADVDVDLAPDDFAGPGLTVAVSHTVDGGAYGLVVGTANALLGVLHLDPLPGITVRATATALYE
jgi:Flp pilus assembly protein TadG